jgi:hypothetical protein
MPLEHPFDPGAGFRDMVVNYPAQLCLDRGAICEPCNRGLGCLRDSIGRLLNAAAYLGRVPGLEVARRRYEGKVVVLRPMCVPASIFWDAIAD